MMIKVRRRSWIARLAYWYGSPGMPAQANLCILFWRSLWGAVLGVLLSILTIVFSPFLLICWLWSLGPERWLEKVAFPRWLYALMGSFGRIVAASFIGLFAVFMITAMIAELGLIGFLSVLGIAVAILLLLALVVWLWCMAEDAWKERRRYRREERWREVRRPSLVTLRVRAWKDKVCPRVELV